MKKQQEVDMLEAAEILKKYKDHKILISLKSVSRTGMSRKVAVYVVVDNDIIYLNHYISNLLQTKRNQEGYITLKGCGMDMFFDLIYRINARICTIDKVELNHENMCKYIFNANNYYRV